MSRASPVRSSSVAAEAVRTTDTFAVALGGMPALAATSPRTLARFVALSPQFGDSPCCRTQAYMDYGGSSPWI